LQSTVAVGFWPAAHAGNELRGVVTVKPPPSPGETFPPGVPVGLHGMSGVGSWPAAHGAKLPTLIVPVVCVGLQGLLMLGV
jgi:hypothetical protein